MEAITWDKAKVFRDRRARRSHLPTGRRLRQEDCCKFEANMSYIVKTRPQGDPVRDKQRDSTT